ncbi:MAG TPA: thiamine phosphate synthase [Candidatus Sumerlaeota bacterium]|nr:MAG: Thiamine-phosphate synthase [candidate division BRC1 bacterium ADurb.BinA292]HOE95136.1 thiamine phosphate synthase [Candidatus Sumerlaeota bacterium]HOR27702.1 thiamine phosphate synthase [Candidatus Sumerlaeota bacterium]HPK01991.1 thiamine phosphate synthase [Candidatus Sumerlaeota bacterium]
MSPQPPASRVAAERLRLIGIADGGWKPWPALQPLAAAALAAGLPALMVRDRELSDRELLPVAWPLREAARQAGALYILNRHFSLINLLAPDALHIGAGDPAPDQLRDHLGDGLAIGYSAHSEDEALQAIARGADYVVLSPVFSTESKPAATPIGLEPLAGLRRRTSTPIIALGGIRAERIQQVLAAGATGVAMIRAVFGGDPAENVHRLQQAVASAHR